MAKEVAELTIQSFIEDRERVLEQEVPQSSPRSRLRYQSKRMSDRVDANHHEGQPRTIVWRHIYKGRLRWAIPNLVIEETPRRLVTLLVPGTVCKAPTSYGRIGYVQQLLEGIEVGDFVWHTRRSLMLAPRDAAHTLSLHWDHTSGDFLGWYVNLQEPMRRTPIGFDTFDQMLDVWIEPDGSWRWKDWDELVEAERVGIFTSAEADAIRAEGQRVIDSLGTLLPTGWEDWQPDPAWRLPTLPDGWDRLDDVDRMRPKG